MCAQVAPSGECLWGYKHSAVDCRRLAPWCDSFLPVLNPDVIPGLSAGTCAVLRCGLLIVCKCVCRFCNKELLYFTLFLKIPTTRQYCTPVLFNVNDL